VKAKFILAMAVVVAITVVTLLCVYQVHRPRISFECYERIQEGMNQSQVEAILGGPPRWEVEAKNPTDEVIYHFNRHWSAEWWGRAGVITVFYDNKGIVWKKSFEQLPFEPKPRSFWDWFP
jgi:hypothetical protein